MTLQDDYHVSLDAFKGPLDLLLFLIRRAEVEVTDIPIAEITDQYLGFLRQIDSIDMDVAGEFLVMAATLVEIKSRVLAARRERKQADVADGEEGDRLDLDEGDPRYELVQQLLAYQRYRGAAEELDRMRSEFSQRFARRPGRAARAEQPQPEEIELDLDDAHVLDLFEAYERIIESVDFSKLGEHQIHDSDTPIGLHQDDLLDRLQRSRSNRLSLQEAWQGRTKSDVIGLFLATLELVRQRRVIVVQDRIDGEIMLELNNDPDDSHGLARPDDASDDPHEAPAPHKGAAQIEIKTGRPDEVADLPDDEDA